MSYLCTMNKTDQQKEATRFSFDYFNHLQQQEDVLDRMLDRKMSQLEIRLDKMIEKKIHQLLKHNK